MSLPHAWFAGRRTVLATRHGKEAQLGPILEPVLGTRLDVLPDFDTDRYGTFDGTRPRVGSQLDAARAKALAAAAEAGCDLALASEGSFAPHPLVPWVQENVELLLLVDLARQQEIMAVARSGDTNFAEALVHAVPDGLAKAADWGFPSHGVIACRQDGTVLAKGIQDAAELERTLATALAAGPVLLKTDMRAMMNPRRQAVICQAAQQLAEHLMSPCPACRWPDFVISERHPGLPCSLCGWPTARTLSARAVCRACGHASVRDFPDGIRHADPRHCDRCNP